MRQTYDLIFGLGNACSATQTLREAKLQFLSFPFDWIIMGGTNDLARRIDFIEDGFSGWLEQKDLVKVRSYPEGNKDIYRNTATDTIFNHEFKMGEDFATRFPAIREKYDRRIARFLGLLKSSKRILILRMDRPDQVPPTTEAECRTALARIRALYPKSSFEMIHLTLANGVRFKSRQVSALGDGLTRVAFDYRDTTPGAAPFAVQFSKTAAAIAALARVRDYRSPEEKKAFSRECRLRHWQKRGATSFLGYIRLKLKIHPLRLRFHGREKYDLIIPMGAACSCSQTLRRAHLQWLSFPFDWLTFERIEDDTCFGFKTYTELICKRFANWLRMEDFEIFAKSDEKAKNEYCLNKSIRMLFLHDFPRGIPLEQSFPRVEAKYRRRTDRLLRLLSQSKRILLFRMDRPDARLQTPVESCRNARLRLSEAFPGLAFDCILLQQNGDIPFDRRLVKEIEPGLTLISFDYRSKNPDALASDANSRQAGAALRDLCAVRDYRTFTERWSNFKKRFRKAFGLPDQPYCPRS